jgi:hypothetical protein
MQLEEEGEGQRSHGWLFRAAAAAVHACMWHAFVCFLTSQFKQNNSHHISQVKDP